MKTLLSLLLTFLTLISCNSQSKKDVHPIKVGGPCEGCEAVLEYGSKILSPIDTLPMFEESEPKLKISGTVYANDGKTPASNVILYIYHTDRKGVYPKNHSDTGWAHRHGHIRGWVKTDSSGEYTFYTFRPAPYPNGFAAAHIHVTLKEAKLNEYFIDDFVFDDDPFLKPKVRKKLENRGGSGIIQVKFEQGILTAKRDIVLGLNIPDYR